MVRVAVMTCVCCWGILRKKKKIKKKTLCICKDTTCLFGEQGLASWQAKRWEGKRERRRIRQIARGKWRVLDWITGCSGIKGCATGAKGAKRSKREQKGTKEGKANSQGQAEGIWLDARALWDQRKGRECNTCKFFAWWVCVVTVYVSYTCTHMCLCMLQECKHDVLVRRKYLQKYPTPTHTDAISSINVGNTKERNMYTSEFQRGKSYTV